MSGWFGRTFGRNRSSSFTAKNVKQYTIDNSPDVKQFKIMVSQLTRFSQTDDAVEFFTDRFSRLEPETLVQANISKETTDLFNYFTPAFLTRFSDYTGYTSGLAFLKSALPVYVPDTSENNALIQIIVGIANTNNSMVVDPSIQFVTAALQKPGILNSLFTDNNALKVWRSVFVCNPESTEGYGDIMIEAAYKYQPPTPESLGPVIENIESTLTANSIPRKSITKAISFVGAIISKVNTGDFIPNYFEKIVDKLIEANTAEPAVHFLSAPSSDRKIVWDVLNKSCQREGISDDYLFSVLKIVNANRSNEDVRHFDIYPFVKIASRIPSDVQKFLFEIVDVYELERKVAFYKVCCPAWETGVNIEQFSEMVVRNDWGNECSSMIEYALATEKPDFHKLFQKTIEFPDYEPALKSMLGRVVENWPCATECLEALLQAVKKSEIVLPCVEDLLVAVMPSLTMKILIDFLTNEPQFTMALFDKITNTANRSIRFVQAFLKENGCDSLTRFIGITQAQNFISALSVFGPYDELESWVSKTDFSTVDPAAVRRMMMGLPQDSNEVGLMRIPSLSRFIDFSLDTAFDKWAYGKFASKHIECPEDKLIKAGSMWIAPQILPKLLESPSNIASLSKISEPSVAVYQLQPAAPFQTASFTSQGATALWVYVEREAETVLFNVAGQDFVLNGPSVTFEKGRAEFEPKKWHCVAFISTMLNAQLQKCVECFVDGVKIGDQVPWAEKEIKIAPSGSKATWYLSKRFVDSSSISGEELKKIIAGGPRNTDGRLEVPLMFVPYGGIFVQSEAFGGVNVFWSTFNNVKTKDDFQTMVIAAFEFVRGASIVDTYLFLGIRCAVLQHPEFLDGSVADIIVLESMKDPRLCSRMLTLLLSDIFFVAAPGLTHNLLPSVISEVQDPTAVLPTLLDSLVFFDLNETARSNIEEAVKAVIAAKPQCIPYVMTAVRGIPFIESDGVESPDDTNSTHIQSVLVNACINAGFPSSMESAVEIVNTIYRVEAIHILQVIAEKCLSSTNYFDLKPLQAMKPAIEGFAENQSVWTTLFTLLFNEKKAMTEYQVSAIKRPGVIPVMFDAALSLFEKEPGSALALAVAKFLLSVVEAGKANFAGVFDIAADLCTIGYTKFVNSNPANSLIDYELSPIVEEERRTPQKGVEEVSSTIEHSFDALGETPYVQARLASLKLPPPPKEEAKPIDSASFVAPADLCETIAKIGAKVALKEANNPTILKKNLIKFGLFSSDVHPECVTAMHRHMMRAFCDEATNLRLNNEMRQIISEFIADRAIEGWWNGNIPAILGKVLKMCPDSPLKISVACLAACQTSDEAIRTAVALINSPAVKTCMKNKHIVDTLTLKIGNAEVMQYPAAASIITAASILPKGPLKEAATAGDLGKTELTDKFRQKTNLYIAELQTGVTKEEPAIYETRLKLSVNHKWPRFSTNRCRFAYYARMLFKSLFYLRYDAVCITIEKAQSKQFQTECRRKYFLNPTVKHMVARSPHPLCIPMKMLPLSFDFVSPYTRQIDALTFKRSTHHTHLNFALKSMLGDQVAALCLKSLSLPAYTMDPPTIAELFKREYGGASPLLSVRMSITSEIMPCVGVFSKTGFAILFDADVDGDGIQLRYNDPLCQFEPLESAAQGLLGKTSLFYHHSVLILDYARIAAVFPRNYAYMPMAVDVFTTDGMHYSILLEEGERKNFITKMKPSFKTPHCGCGPYYAFDLQQTAPSVVAKRWARGRMSNLDYLLYVNSAAGRSFVDFAQYPVAPWVIGDYANKSIQKMRNLAKPMGVQTPDRIERFKQMYEETEDHYHYGTHYSHPAAVFHFMLRVEPYTLFGFQLHNGWDHRDRIFSDVDHSWRSASETNQTDLKELIPEFYAFPDIFDNPNDLPIRNRSDGKDVKKVRLPPWAGNSLEFVWIMRAAIEETDIAPWFDLIFGCKQRGNAAIEAMNVFQPLTYGQMNSIASERLDTKGRIDAINNFGQCPQQIFSSPHIHQVKRITAKVCANANVTRLVAQTGMTSMTIAEDSVAFCGPREVILCDRAVPIDGAMMRRLDLEDVTCKSTTGDGTIAAIASSFGIVSVISGLSDQVSVIRCPDCCFQAVLATAHYGAVFAATKDKLMMLDLGTRFLSRSTDCDNIKYIDVHVQTNLLVSASDDLIKVRYVDFKPIASARSSGITALSCADQRDWEIKPRIATGHSDGSVRVWEVDVLAKTIQQAAEFRPTTSKIVCVKMMAHNAAILLLDEEGSLYAISAPSIGKFLEPALFDECCVCGQKKQLTSSICRSCGRLACSKCLTHGICAKCHNSGIDEITDEEEDSKEFSIEVLQPVTIPGMPLPEARGPRPSSEGLLSDDEAALDEMERLEKTKSTELFIEEAKPTEKEELPQKETKKEEEPKKEEKPPMSAPQSNDKHVHWTIPVHEMSKGMLSHHTSNELNEKAKAEADIPVPEPISPSPSVEDTSKLDDSVLKQDSEKIEDKPPKEEEKPTKVDEKKDSTPKKDEKKPSSSSSSSSKKDDGHHHHHHSDKKSSSSSKKTSSSPRSSDKKAPSSPQKKPSTSSSSSSSKKTSSSSSSKKDTKKSPSSKK